MMHVSLYNFILKAFVKALYLPVSLGLHPHLLYVQNYMRFFYRFLGFTLCDRVRSLAIQESLKIGLLQIKMSHPDEVALAAC